MIPLDVKTKDTGVDPSKERKVINRLISCYDYLKLDTQKSEYV